MAEQTGRGSRSLSTVERSWEIIRFLQDTRRSGVTQIAKELDMSKASTHTHLATLLEEGIVVQEETQYRLSLNFISLGDHVRIKSTLYNGGRPIVDKLANESGEYVHLVTNEGSSIVYLYGSGGEKAIATEFFKNKIKKPGDFHAMASGKAILAFLEEATVDRILDQSDLEQYTENTITETDALRSNLDRVRERGFALNDEEEILGIRAVGAPIFSKRGSVIGSLSISKPKGRVDDSAFRDRIPDRVISAANAIEARVQDMETV